jgi:uncharacterized protein with NRDE domain
MPHRQNSRGELVVNCLNSPLRLKDWFNALIPEALNYSGFNLIAGELSTREVRYFSNRDSQHRRLTAGCFALSNGNVDDNWPKMQQLQNQLQQHIRDNRVNSHKLFDLLFQPTPFSNERLPNTGVPENLEQSLSSIFVPTIAIEGRDYGTRSSTLMLVDRLQKVHLYERSYNSKQQIINQQQIRFFWSDT